MRKMVAQLRVLLLIIPTLLQASLDVPKAEPTNERINNISYILKVSMRLSVKQTTTNPIMDMYRTMSGYTEPLMQTIHPDDFVKVIKRRRAATERFMMNSSLIPSTTPIPLPQTFPNRSETGETLRLMTLMAATSTNDGTLDQLSACTCDCPSPTHNTLRRVRTSSSPSGCPNYPCLNGGIYFSMNNGRDCGCQCKPGFYGVHCHKKQKPTSMTNCQCENGGECVAVQKRKLCHCPLGYMGDQCQYKVQRQETITPPPVLENVDNLMLCSDNPCLNDGICLRNLSELKTVCYCRPGFGGNRCQQTFM